LKDEEPFFPRIYSVSAATTLHIGKPVLEIEAANQVAIGLDAVG